jgi:Shikimate 5-dehydrogenase
MRGIQFNQTPMPPSKDTYTTADLDHWDFQGTALAVVGHPIKHSISPSMHNAALAALARTDARFADWKYFRFDVPPEELPAALERFHQKGFRGLNLTVPHKVIAFNELKLAGTQARSGDPTAHHTVDRAAQPIGAVNTLHRTDTGWHGHNTDGYGLAAAVNETLSRSLDGAHVILLGAGGAARGAAIECIQRRCTSLWIANRTRINLDALLLDLAPHAGQVLLQGFDPQQPPANLPAGALVINATSAGLRESDPLPVDLRALPKPAGVYDMIYNPPETRLLAQARELGILAASGLSMLVHQGARALEIWTGVSVPVEAMRTAAEGALRRS